jgi:penicillin amidase
LKPSNRSAGRRRGLGRSITALAGATVLTLLVTTVSMAGAGTLPPLGAALNPGTGVWTAAADGKLPADQTIKLPGMDGTATVGFEANGVAHITAGTDADMFRAMGYTHARFRLFQMDLARRVAEGRLAEAVGGSAALTSDKYELDVGLVRAAQRDWRELPAGSVARAALTSYATGVNDAIAQLARDHALPLYYKILNLPVAPWTPVDSLAIQRYETQTLSLDLLPTAYSYIARGLGEPLFNQMYQAMPQNPQNPYDPGPYRKLPLAPLPPRDDGTPTPQGTLTAADGQAAASTQYIGASPMAVAASSAILARAGSLPSGAFHTFGNSNIWVISGRLTASGKPILAADPHLSLTVPSIWYQMELRSPSYHVSGVSVPGIPAILIGKNQHIAWSITNSQRPGTLYYLEKTDKAHPGQYFWDGAWRPMTKITYKIRVKGRHPVTHTVRLTVHGPIMTNQGVAASVWYAGTLPSDNLTSIWQVARATDFAQFHQALRGWGVPAQNFGYADDMGNIGIVNVGYQPEIRSGVQWLPLSGTGASDVAGTIPYDALPIVYNPPQGFAATANQREVGASYPYYFGRGYDFIDQGWRAAEIVRDLGGRTGITAAQMARMQMDDADGTARALLPTLLRVLGGQPLGPLEAKAVNELKAWNYHLDGGSVAATIWTRFLILYDYAVWHPIWIQHHVPAPPRDVFTPRTSDGTYAEDALQGMLINLSVRDQANAIFAPPTAPGRTAASIMREVFAGTVKDLESKRGPDIATWRYGAKHYVMMASLLQQTVLDQGPYHYGGNGRVINSIVSVAPIRGGKRLFGVAAGGASYRMVTDWGTGQTLTAFPGGQSENPASPWYADGISGWLQGRMTPMIEGAQAVAASKGRIWTLTP